MKIFDAELPNKPVPVADHWNCGICNCSHHTWGGAEMCCSDIYAEVVRVSDLRRWLTNEIDATLNESGNNPFDEGYMECCKRLKTVLEIKQ